MASGVSVSDPETMRRGAADTRQAHDDLMTQVKGINAKVEVLRVKWQGPSASAFQDLMVEWREEAERLLREMSEIADNLEKGAGLRDTQQDRERQRVGQLTTGKFGAALNPGQQ